MMNTDKRFSDEFLNSFVDNQLTPEEKSQAYSEIAEDEAVNRQVCELRKLHDLVQLAYRDVAPPPAAGRSGGAAHHGRLRFGVAAAILLVIGVVLGLQVKAPKPVTVAAVPQPDATHQTAPGDQTPIARRPPVRSPAAVAPRAAAGDIGTGRPAAPAERPTTPDADDAAALSSYQATIAPTPADRGVSRVLVHITNNDPKRLSQALQDIEGLMHYYQDNRQRARVEVVVNGPGLDLLRRDRSRFGEQIARLQRQYGDLRFAACQNTIDIARRKQGRDVPLLPGVIVVDSGIAEITRRQTEGWAYLQV